MIKLFSWAIVFGVMLFSLATILGMFNEVTSILLMITSISINIISVVGLLISLVIERIHDKKREENNHDLDKY